MCPSCAIKLFHRKQNPFHNKNGLCKITHPNFLKRSTSPRCRKGFYQTFWMTQNCTKSSKKESKWHQNQIIKKMVKRKLPSRRNLGHLLIKSAKYWFVSMQVKPALVKCPHSWSQVCQLLKTPLIRLVSGVPQHEKGFLDQTTPSIQGTKQFPINIQSASIWNDF